MSTSQQISLIPKYIVYKLNFRLFELNIEDNSLNDECVNVLLHGLNNNKSLKILNLSKNFVTDQVILFNLQSCKKLCESFRLHKNLRELYIHWNKITE